MACRVFLFFSLDSFVDQICFIHTDGNDGMVAGKCPNRTESAVMDSKSQSLVLMNFFTTNPSQTGVCGNNSAPLVSMLKTCHDASGNRWPNYIAVDLYMVCEYLLNPFTWAVSPFQGSCNFFVMKSLTLLNLNHAEE